MVGYRLIAASIVTGLGDRMVLERSRNWLWRCPDIGVWPWKGGTERGRRARWTVEDFKKAAKDDSE